MRNKVRSHGALGSARFTASGRTMNLSLRRHSSVTCMIASLNESSGTSASHGYGP